MYKVTKQNGESFYIETLKYCYALPSGAPQCVRSVDKERATAVICDGRIYNLAGHNDYEGKDTVSVNECDIGAIFTARDAAQQDTDEQTVELAYRLSLMELGVN